jgi:hypothetical protein
LRKTISGGGSEEESEYDLESSVAESERAIARVVECVSEVRENDEE